MTYASIVGLETLGLPDGNIDSVHAIADASNDTRDDHLNFLERRGLQDCANDHDPATNSDTTLSTKTIGRQECDDGSYKTANIIDGSNDAFKIWIGVLESMTERLEANDGAQDTLVIAKQLGRHVSRRYVLTELYSYRPGRRYRNMLRLLRARDCL